MPIFNALYKRFERSGIASKKTKEAHDFIRKAAGKLYTKKTHADRFLKTNASSLTSNMTVGKMYLFNYDPKLKETLPWYDIYPLIFPIERYNDGFLGINMHYLPPLLRSKLMDALYDLAKNESKPEKAKLRISYQILKAASKYKLFEPCLHRYLYGYMKSQFLEIPYEEWEMALMIPLQQFKKATSREVWSHSKSRMR